MKKSTKIGLIVGGTSLVAICSYFFIYKKYFRRDMTNKGLEFLTAAEGYSKKAYKDVKGLWTTGVGHLIDLVKESHLITKVLTDSEVKEILNKDLDWAEKVVNETIKVPLTPHKKDALISLAFNIGKTAFETSSLVKLINAKAPESEIKKAFAKWRIPAKIMGRRAKEIRLFTTGNYSDKITPNEINSYFV